MAIAEAFLQELEEEARTTERVLERVPDAQLDWRPHPKSDSLGSTGPARRADSRLGRHARDAAGG